MADVQIAVIDPEDTQLALAAPAEAVVNVAVPGVQGPIGLTGSVAIAQDGTATEPGIRFESDTNTGIYRPGADQLAVSTGGTGRLFIDASGNVATGIATFPKAFTINSVNAAIELRANSGGAGFTAYSDQGLFFSVDATKYAQIYNDGVGQLIFRTSSGLSERLRITSAGLVGIGTSSPNSALDVNGDVTITDKIIHSGDTNTAIRFPAADTVSVETAGSERARIDSSGRLGIGTSSPSSLLHLKGGVTGTTLRVEGSAASDYTFFQLINPSGMEVQLAANGTEAARLLTNTNHPLDFFTNGTRAIRIDTSQRVGIGTTSPGSALEINAAAATSPFIAKINTSEAARIDSSGRLLVGTSLGVSTPAYPTSWTTQYTARQQLHGIAVADASNVIANWGSTSDAPPNLSFAKSRSNAIGTYGVTALAVGSTLGNITFTGDDGAKFVAGAAITAIVDGTPGTDDMPGRLVFSTTPDGAASPTERLRITSAGVLQVADAGNIQVGTTTGTKIGTATTQKLGFYNATPVVQPTAVADATDAATVITQLNALLTRMRNLGLIAT
jgi:hypothetical protein